MDLPAGIVKSLKAGLFGSHAATLPLLADKTPATEFTIFQAGVNDGDYGPITFDEIAAAFVMQALQEKGLSQLPFDFNHGMAKEYATAEEGKAAGYFTPEVRDGALMATNCQYTEEAYGRIKAGEYSLFSPWFDTITTADDVVRPCRLFNVAILNCAGLNGIQPIAAGVRTANEESDMTPQEEQQIRDRLRALEVENEQLRAGRHELASLGTTMQLGAGHGATERANGVHRLMALRTEVFRTTGKDTDEAAIGELHAIKARAAEVDTLKAAAEKADQDGLAKELDTVFALGAQKGSVAASPASRKKFDEVTLAAMKRLTGGKLTSDMIVVAREQIEMSARVNTSPSREAEERGASLPDGLKKNLSGLRDESVQKAFERQQARRAARGA